MTIKFKLLHSVTENNIQIQTTFRLNTNTNHIGIGNYFSKSERKPKPINKDSSQYLGITCAEKVLEHVFKNVEKMKFGNPGFDFKCGQGYLVDSKASCTNKKYNSWSFRIRKNKTADYFALLAFDNRNDINPLYFWLIPGNVINDKQLLSISKSTFYKWNEYRQDIDKIIKCCNTLKRDD